MNNELPLIQLKKVNKIYAQRMIRYEALKDIDLTINHGEYVVIFGPSGSGKSTLMNILGCLSTSTSGSYLLNGKEVSELSRNNLAIIRNRTIGFVFQGFNLLPNLTTVENVALPLAYRGIALKKRTDMAREMLAKLGLSEHLQQLPNELSGGEQQRVAIARAFVNDPEIILADEPTGNLDSQTGCEVIQILDEISKRGKTVVVVTHDMELASNAKRVVRMKDGKIIGKEGIVQCNYINLENSGD